MKIRELEERGLIRRFDARKEEVEDTFRLAQRDAELAKKVVKEDLDWGFNIAYNSMLQAARAYMLSKGYKTSEERAHVSVAMFCEESLGNEFREMMQLFDRMRKKRHIAVYQKTGSITEYEANYAVTTAGKFLRSIKEKLKI